MAFDKPTAKSARGGGRASRAPTSVTLPHATFRELGAATVLDAVVARLGLPLMVKPARGGSALGATVVHARPRPARRDGAAASPTARPR